MIKIAPQKNNKPIIEKFSFKDVNKAISKVKSNKIRYRAVLTNE
jgi:D-arabinose 1-dehydrogenase-like Zn-dependent alcohol dehydrogenase